MNALVVLVISIVCLVILSLWMHTRQKLNAFALQLEQQQTSKTVENKLSALNAGSIGLGERLIKMEREMQALLARVDDLQSQVQTNTPYAQAIQMIQRGESAKDIVAVCNISFNEAQLLVKLHQQDQVA